MKKRYRAADERFDSRFEEQFEEIWKGHSRYPIVHHHIVKTERTWEIDFAFPDLRIAIELQGYGGGHTGYLGMLRDIEKYNSLTILGWTVIYFMSTHINQPEYILNTINTIIEKKHGTRIQQYRTSTRSPEQQPNRLLEARRRLANKKTPNQ